MGGCEGATITDLVTVTVSWTKTEPGEFETEVVLLTVELPTTSIRLAAIVEKSLKALDVPSLRSACPYTPVLMPRTAPKARTVKTRTFIAILVRLVPKVFGCGGAGFLIS